MVEFAKAGPKRSSPGFTLLELTVALAIVAVVATVVFQLQNQGFRSFLRTRQMTNAVLLAQELLADAHLSESLPGKGRTQTSDGDVLFWERLVVTSGFSGVQAVRILIRRSENLEPILDVMTYVANKS